MIEPDILKAINIFKLKVSEIFCVSESHSSKVRILSLHSGEKVVVKIPWNIHKLNREREAMILLENHPLTPNLLDCAIQEEYGALLISFIEGETISTPKILTQNLAFQIGEAMAKMHEIEMSDFDGKKSWHEHLKSKISTNISLVRKQKNTSYLDLLEAKYSELIELVPNSKPSLIHYDFRLGNLLTKDNNLVGLIDFESTRGGASDMDFFKIWREVWITNTEYKSAIIEGYESVKQINSDLDLVLPIYATYHAIAGMAWCLIRDKPNDSFFNYSENLLSNSLKDLNIIK